jgi:AmiR/NasT family two-component response regulator
MARSRILIVHPEQAPSARLASMLRSWRFEIVEPTDERVALRMQDHAFAPGLVLHAVDTDRRAASELLYYIRRKHPKTAVILVTPDPRRHGGALRLGAAAALKSPDGGPAAGGRGTGPAGGRVTPPVHP